MGQIILTYVKADHISSIFLNILPQTLLSPLLNILSQMSFIPYSSEHFHISTKATSFLHYSIFSAQVIVFMVYVNGSSGAECDK